MASNESLLLPDIGYSSAFAEGAQAERDIRGVHALNLILDARWGVESQADITEPGRRDIYTENLRLVQEWNHEQSLERGEIIDLGRLTDVARRAEWTGAISLDQRLQSGELHSGDVDEAVRIIGECYVPTSRGAVSRCFDGRNAVGYVDTNPFHYGQPLGPQSPGGTPGAAISFRLAVGNEDTPFREASNADDIMTLAQIDRETGFEAGGHRGEGAESGKAGCAFIDGQEGVILPKFIHTYIDELERVSRLVLGDDYREEDFNHTYASAGRLLNVSGHYFAHGERVMEMLEASNPGAAPTLAGSHREGIAVVNFVPSDTLHTGHFNNRTGSKVQAFNYEFGHTQARARKLDVSPQVKSRYLHARAALAVATLMGFTDGSQRLLLRVPRGSLNVAA